MSTWLIVLGIYCVGIIGGFSFFIIEDFLDAKKYKWKIELSTYDIGQYFMFGLIWPVILVVESGPVFTHIFKCIGKLLPKIGDRLNKPLITIDYRVKENKEIL